GAFTDARKNKPGRVEVASGGTLFLNEIGNLSLPLQAKLLSVIEQRKSSRLGSTTSYPVDVRLICATNTDLYTAIDNGQFR
ncbi:UNVERIFIED_CONTAM: sigma-54 factor interaction domain-containing protein, partial [Prevotella sp. 15_C9]